MVQINPSELNKRLSFGLLKTTKNPHTNLSVKKYKETCTRWTSIRTQSINQQYTLAGMGHKNTLLVAIWHDKSNQSFTHAMMNEKVYEVINISTDESIGLNRFDLLTLSYKKGLSVYG